MGTSNKPAFDVVRTAWYIYISSDNAPPAGNENANKNVSKGNKSLGAGSFLFFLTGVNLPN